MKYLMKSQIIFLGDCTTGTGERFIH